MIGLLAFLWFFNTSQPAQSTLTPNAGQSDFIIAGSPSDGFTVRMTVDLTDFEGEKNILEIPDVLNVSLRQHDPGGAGRRGDQGGATGRGG